MQTIFTNWRTSLAGVAAAVTALGDLLTQIASGNVGSGAIERDVVAILVGVGLLAAKDGAGK